MITTLLIILWVYASVSKLIDFERTQSEMLNQVFPIYIAYILAGAVPAGELITAVLLLFEKTRFMGLIASAILLISFTVYIVLVLNKVFGWIPCSCGGILNQLGWGQHLAFNIGFIFLTLPGIYYEFKERRLRQTV